MQWSQLTIDQVLFKRWYSSRRHVKYKFLSVYGTLLLNINTQRVASRAEVAPRKGQLTGWVWKCRLIPTGTHSGTFRGGLDIWNENKTKWKTTDKFWSFHNFAICPF